MVDQQVIIEDFYPTILEMAGIKNYETVQKVDGVSFLPTLSGNTSGVARPLFWHYPNEWGPSGPGIGASSSTRVGDWKFIYYYNDSSMELFNIKEDIGETRNLVKEQPEKARELAKILSDYLRKVEAQIPSRKDTGEQIAYPDGILNTFKS